MNFSAAWSSSSVVTPARAFEASIFRQRTRTSPEAAVRSVCSGVLRLTIRYTALDRLVPLQTHRRQRAADLLRHLVGRPLAVEPAQHAAMVVVVDQRLGLLVVGLQALANHVG